MEESIRKMASINYKSVVFMKHWCKRRIKLREALVADLPATLCYPSKNYTGYSVDRWDEKGGLLYYHHVREHYMLPPSDALLFVECPLQHEQFERFIAGANREVIVYRPPTWEMQEERVTTIHPDHSVVDTLILVMGLMGRSKGANELEQAALSSSTWEAKCFTGAEIRAVTGISEAHLQVILNKYFRRKHARQHPYRLNHPPDDPAILSAYREVEAANGLLYFNKIEGNLLPLIKGRYITTLPVIYVVKCDLKARKPHVVNAIANAHRGDWYKMKNLVDNAPDYLEEL